jgi:disulfide bond formation protein DsbB
VVSSEFVIAIKMHDTKTTMEMRIPSVFSLFGTALVIITFVIFERLRKLRYAEIVFYIAINDFIASIGTVMGTYHNSIECWYQGLATNFNYLVAIFWTNVIAYQLYAIVVKNQECIKDMRRYHMVCWLVPLVVTLLPLTTNTYGEADDNSGWCFIAERPDSPSYGVLLWVILSFYLWVWLSILFITVVLLRTGYHLYELNPVPPPVYNVYYKLGLYPLVLILCWLPASLDDTLAAVFGGYSFPGSIVLNVCANVLPPLQGFLLSVIFFSSNKAVRLLWINLICGGKSASLKIAGQAGMGAELINTPDKRSFAGTSTRISEALDFGVAASLSSWDLSPGSSFDMTLEHRLEQSESSRF